MPQAHSHSPPFRIFQVVPIFVDDDNHACLSNDAETVAIFLWSRNINKYQLYVNGREYGWSGIAELRDIEIHLRYCQEMDEVLYEHG